MDQKYKQMMKIGYIFFILSTFIYSNEEIFSLEFQENTIQKLKHMDAHIIWIKETKSELLMPRLSKGFSKQKQERINPILEDLHTLYANNILQCGAMEMRFYLGYVSENLLSIYTYYTYDCANQRSGSTRQGYLYDLNTAQRYTLNHLLEFQKNTPIRNGKNWDVWESYRENIFAPKLRDEILKLKSWKTQQLQKSLCDYSDVQVWKDPFWVLLEEGIEFKPYFPYSLTGCMDQETIIFSKDWLLQYKNTNFPDILDY
ncbi:MAG: hypothetical protein U9N30_10710 [Campylobacterota bacterium]|nr:hypothetical protein [Campylobacterota bacterium]